MLDLKNQKIMKIIRIAKFLILVNLISAGFIVAQDRVSVDEKEMKIGKNTLNVFVSTVGTDPEIVRKSFIRYVKQNLMVKLKHEGKNRMIAEKVKIPSFTDKTGDLIAKSYHEGNRAYLAVGFSMGYDLAINKNDHIDEAKKIEEFLFKYVIYHETNYFKDILKENQKRLNELVKTLGENEKEMKNLLSRIKKIDKSISKEKDPNTKFELSNENIANRARIQAINDITINLSNEIQKVNSNIENMNNSLNNLESQTIE